MNSPETALWRAVILQQFVDATARVRTSRDRHHRDVARFWLLRGTETFCVICDLASLPPRIVRRRAAELAAAGWPYTKFNISNGPKGVFS